jgi:hypothetical protein
VMGTRPLIVIQILIEQGNPKAEGLRILASKRISNIGLISMDAATESGIRAKLWAAWRMAREFTALGLENYGKVVNIAKTGDILYDALFPPQSWDLDICVSAYDDVTLLQRALPEKARNIPDRALFVRTFRHVMTNRVAFAEAYFTGAVEAVRRMLDRGPVWIWTSGDVYGVPSLKLPGSYEQLKRVARGGLSSLRKMHPHLSVAAHEDKMCLLRDITQRAAAQGIGTLVVIDDRVDNLVGAQKLITKSDDSVQRVVLLWARGYEAISREGPRLPKDFRGTAEDAIAHYGLMEIRDLTETVPRVQRVLGAQRKIAWIVDHDDVISCDRRRVQLQEDKVIEWLTSEYWP